MMRYILKIAKLYPLIAQSVAQKKDSMFRQLFKNIAGIVALAVAALAMGIALLVALVFALYMALTHHGYSDMQALFIVLTGIALILAVISGLLVAKLKSFSGNADREAGVPAPMTEQVLGIADSFVDGILTRPIPKTKKNRKKIEYL